MTSTVVKFLAISALGLASIATSPVQAQQVYRIIGADGKVTFSDKPPVSEAQGKVTLGAGASGGTASSSRAGRMSYQSPVPVSIMYWRISLSRNGFGHI